MSIAGVSGDPGVSASSLQQQFITNEFICNDHECNNVQGNSYYTVPQIYIILLLYNLDVQPFQIKPDYVQILSNFQTQASNQ